MLFLKPQLFESCDYRNFSFHLGEKEIISRLADCGDAWKHNLNVILKAQKLEGKEKDSSSDCSFKSPFFQTSLWGLRRNP